MASSLNEQVVQSRLARLAAHLTSQDSLSNGEEAQQHVTRVHTASVVSDGRPTPGGGPGKLLITDSRTGKKYELDVDEHGQVKGTDLKQIVAGGDGIGLRAYDPGCVVLWLLCIGQYVYICILCKHVSSQVCQHSSVQVGNLLHRREQGHPAISWVSH